MKQIIEHRSSKKVCLGKRATISLAVGSLCLCVVAGVSVAGPPLYPLAPPFYSFDAISPTVDNEEGLDANDILQLTPNPNPPDEAVDGGTLGLDDALDALDALSSGNPAVDAATKFLLLYSIDRPSVANMPPDRELQTHGVPYNALEQAKKGHAAGDQYMALYQFDLLPSPRGGGLRMPATSVQTRNQYNEGGSDFGGEPKDGSSRPGGRGDLPLLQDNVSSMMMTGRSQGGLGEVYFSATWDSPSLTGVLNGAYIFYYAGVGTIEDLNQAVFASSAALGLNLPGDDIDGMIVYDTNGAVGVFDEDINGKDRVLFSLTQLSPSRLIIAGHSLNGGTAADVFSVSFGEAPTTFANADNLGLGFYDGGLDLDNVDALDYFACVCEGEDPDSSICRDPPNPTDRECAMQYGVRGRAVPAMTGWGMVVFILIVVAAGIVVIRRASRRPA
ncbi:MAG: hypothetical protein ACYTFA_18285 [Planctomycetota bacterium]|jgi:hypothetical protein